METINEGDILVVIDMSDDWWRKYPSAKIGSIFKVNQSSGTGFTLVANGRDDLSEYWIPNKSFRKATQLEVNAYNINGIRHIELMSASYLTGRYIQALVDNPDSGANCWLNR